MTRVSPEARPAPREGAALLIATQPFQLLLVLGSAYPSFMTHKDAAGAAGISPDSAHVAVKALRDWGLVRTQKRWQTADDGAHRQVARHRASREGKRIADWVEESRRRLGSSTAGKVGLTLNHG